MASRNTVRIIGGKWRGRKLTFGNFDDLRPTADRGRETLFSWLDPMLQGSHCLDLFAGSGSLGFEALSRGAASATMIDVRAAVIARLSEQASSLGATPVIVRADARNWLRRAQSAAQRYDVIFLDPPFAADLLNETLPLVCAIAATRGVIYIEQPQHGAATQIPNGWFKARATASGSARLALLARDLAPTREAAALNPETMAATMADPDTPD